jgi:hypothetical protein
MERLMARANTDDRSDDEALSEDLLDGAERIAEYTGWPTRRVFYLLEKGLIPAFKMGNRWIARKSRLRRHIEDLEEAARGE